MLAFQSTPSAWRETIRRDIAANDIPFQSTPSAWRETSVGGVRERGSLYFNPLPPRGGRQHSVRVHKPLLCISIHSLRVEGDRRSSYPAVMCLISIHSLRMEGDKSDAASVFVLGNFNPLPPRGGRLISGNYFVTILHFNPLPPRGGRRPRAGTGSLARAISIHSLRVEGDQPPTQPRAKAV